VAGPDKNSEKVSALLHLQYKTNLETFEKFCRRRNRGDEGQHGQQGSDHVVLVQSHAE